MRKAWPAALAMGLAGTLAAAVTDQAAGQKRNRDVITREEIMSSAQRESDLYRAVRSLRPHFLAGPRGVRSLGNAPAAATVVYVDGNRMGEADRLSTILASHVEEVRYLDPVRAENQLGIGASGGAILVKLLTRREGEAKPDTSGSSWRSVGSARR